MGVSAAVHGRRAAGSGVGRGAAAGCVVGGGGRGVGRGGWMLLRLGVPAGGWECTAVRARGRGRVGRLLGGHLRRGAGVECDEVTWRAIFGMSESASAVLHRYVKCLSKAVGCDTPEMENTKNFSARHFSK
jgi:hypothetical protein